MLTAVTVLALVILADPPERKEPPAQGGTGGDHRRGRDLAGYDAAAWHASDALQAKQPKEGSFVRYIARKTDKGWVVAFGRLDEKQEKFLIAYEATQGSKPDVFDVKEINPPKEDTGFFLSAARAIDTSSRTSSSTSRASSVPITSPSSPQRRGILGLPRPGPDEAGRLAAGRRCPIPDVGGWHEDPGEAAAAQVDHRGRAAEGQGQAAGGGHPHARPGRHPGRH